MQIERDYLINTGPLDEIGYEPAHHRCAPPASFVAPSIAEIRRNPRNTRRGRAPARIRNAKNFHQVLIYRRAGRLNDKDATPPDRFLKTNVDFGVGKPFQSAGSQLDLQQLADSQRQLSARASAHDDGFAAGPFQINYRRPFHSNLECPMFAP